MQLPASVREIADVIGRDKALQLVGQLPRCFAGQAGKKSWHVVLYVPKNLRPDHPLVGILGWASAEKLVDAFGGEILQPANCAEIYRRFRDRAIVRMLGEGMKAAAIAEAVMVSARLVRNLARENPQEACGADKAKTAANALGVRAA